MLVVFCPSDHHGGPHVRVSSPTPGCSIFIMSAPRSPRTIVAKGPANTREKSAMRRFLKAP